MSAPRKQSVLHLKPKRRLNPGLKIEDGLQKHIDVKKQSISMFNSYMNEQLQKDQQQTQQKRTQLLAAQASGPGAAYFVNQKAQI